MFCILFYVVFPPFYDESIRALTHKVARGEYTFLSPWWDPITPAAKDLITNLLNVDPEKRYTINDFFKHPWITGSQFPPAAVDESLLTKPLTEKKFKSNDPRAQAMQNAASKAAAQQQETNRQAQVYNDMVNKPTTPNGKPAKRTDVFSPGITSIKEILDITYAVQRMGEEKQNKRGNTPGASNLTREAFAGGYDSISEEEDEDEDEISDSSSNEYRAPIGIQKDVMAMAEQLVQDGKGIAPGAYNISAEKQKTAQDTAPMATPASRRRRNVFELDMNKATLVEE